MGKKVDHTSINESVQRQIAADVIDKVEWAIRQAHPQVEKLASTWKPEEDVEPPNTLLYGEKYYNLEDELTELFVGKFAKKGVRAKKPSP